MATDPIRDRLRAAIRAAFGPNLSSALLYGSRARGDARADSDYDVAVFLVEYDGGSEALFQLADAVWPIELETGVGVSALPFAAAEIDRGSHFMINVRRDGVPL